MLHLYQNILFWDFSDGSIIIEDSTFPMFTRSSLYTGKVGESLLDIAYKFYGSHREWHLIAKVNNIIDPWQDIAGIKLTIPIYE